MKTIERTELAELLERIASAERLSYEEWKSVEE
jgi:hypothetical protein